MHAVKLERLASDDGSTRAPVLLVDENLMVHLYPDTAEVPSPLMTLDCAPVLLVDENLMLHLYPDTVEVPSPLMALDCA